MLYSAALSLPLIGLIATSDSLMTVMTHPGSMTGSLRAMAFGPEAVGILLVTALVKTALAEEILFRGFLAKRLIAWLGYARGNLLQAVFFGALHSALFYAISSNLLLLFVIFLFPTVGASEPSQVNLVTLHESGYFLPAAPVWLEVSQ
ncbi:MAG: CPBP family intramembrane glutamic endopeptidase [Balneolaceae bacterium]|nr:CPBP family intramembrane glutamic endopeptidase [Balneolaceae bacterium]